MVQKRKHDDQEQSQRFRETAEKLKADKTGESFRKALKAVIPPVKPLERTKRRG